MQLNLITTQHGVGIVEVLVSVVIISVSLLGLSALINNSLQINQTAYTKTAAAILVYDIADRIRANPGQDYSVNLTYTPPEQADKSCELNVCTPLQMRNYDVNQWLQFIQRNLTNGDASIRIAGNTAQVTIVWLNGAPTSDEAANDAIEIQVSI